MQKNKKRIDLLPQAEIDDLYERPIFNDEERLLYFTLNEKETALSKKVFECKDTIVFHVATRIF